MQWLRIYADVLQNSLALRALGDERDQPHPASHYRFWLRAVQFYVLLTVQFYVLTELRPGYKVACLVASKQLE